MIDLFGASLTNSVSRSFPLRRGWPARVLIAPLAPGPWTAELDEETLSVRIGWLGGADVPLGLIARVSRLAWPWWAGIGVRLGRGLVAFVLSSGPAAVFELTEPIRVRAPLPWHTRRVVIGAEDVDRLIEAVAAARRAH
jgi:hypothetical protein